MNNPYYIAGVLANKEWTIDLILDYDYIEVDEYTKIVDKCEPKHFKMFMMGYLDAMKNKLNLTELKLYLSDDNKKLVKYPFQDCNKYIVLTGVNITDFLGDVYDIKQLTSLFPVVSCKYFKASENAVVPSKTRLSDVGYDLTIISEYKKLNQYTTLYDTGIQVSIEPHFYIEVVPRSSLSKSGYMLANSMGIIDQSYRGNIYIALTRINPDAEPIELPFKCCQIIIRPQYQAIFTESTLSDTHRGDGGFGSTNL